MTPKEKALELFDKFNNPDTTHYPYVHNAQQCALICCDEVLGYMGADRGYEFWTEVKKELEQL